MPTKGLPTQDSTIDISRLTAEKGPDVVLTAGSKGAALRRPYPSHADIGIRGCTGLVGSKVGPCCLIAKPSGLPRGETGLLLSIFFGLSFAVETGFFGFCFFSDALCFSVCLCFCFALGLRLPLRFFAFDLLRSVTTELLACVLSSALCCEVVGFLTSLLGFANNFFLISALTGGARARDFGVWSSISLGRSCLADKSGSRQTVLKRLSLSLEQLFKFTLESLELVESASEFFCIVVVVVIAVVATATGVASSIIAVAIVIVARIATVIVFIIAMPLHLAKPPVRHIGCLVLVVSLAERVLCKVEQHFLEISITDSRTNELSHQCFRRLDVVVSYRVATAPSTRRRIADASDRHSIGIHKLEQVHGIP
jgi:hypothetical protein